MPEQLPADASPPSVRPFREPAVWLITALFLLHGAAYAVAAPVWQAPDEPQHVAAIRYIHQHLTYPNARTATVQPEIIGSLIPSHFYELQEPTATWWRGAKIAPWRSLDEIHGATPGGLISVDGHPPAYYYVMAPIEALASRLSFPAEVLVLRLVTLLIAAPAIPLGYATLRTLWPSWRRLAVAATGLVALLPQFAHVSASVNNDPLLVTLFTAALYVCARMLTDGLTRRRALWAALVGAGAILTKEHGALLIGVIGIAALVAVKSRTGSASHAALAVALPVLAAVGWYGGRLALGLPVTTTDAFPRPPDPHPISFLYYARVFCFRPLTSSFWGLFGWLTVRLPHTQYKALEDVTGATGVISIVAGAVAAIRRRATRAQIALGASALGCLAAIGLVVVYLSWRGYERFGQPRGLQGRYFFPLVFAIAVMIVGGLLVIVPRRLRGIAAAGIIAGMVVLAGESLTRILRAFYGPQGTGTATLLRHLSRYSPITVAGPLVVACAAAALAAAIAVAMVAARGPGAPGRSLVGSRLPAEVAT